MNQAVLFLSASPMANSIAYTPTYADKHVDLSHDSRCDKFGVRGHRHPYHLLSLMNADLISNE